MHRGLALSGTSEPDAPSRPSPLRVPDPDVVDQLHAACLIAVQHDPTGTTAAYSAAEYEVVRSAVARFVAWCRPDLTPERILVQLKRAVNDSLRTVGREPHEEVLRGIILETFLRSYYGDAARSDVTQELR